MSPTRIKICGVKSPEMAEIAVKAGASYVGVVFVEKSPRFVTPEAAAEIVAAVREARPEATAVGLFADQSREEVTDIAQRAGISTVQLHGDPAYENADYMLQLPGFQIIKALPFRNGPIDPQFRQFRFPDMLLFDTPPARGATLRGGSGHTLDWERLVPHIRAIHRPVFLAGGLEPDNVAEAVKTCRPWGVDVSSGVERERGVKDADLVRAFCEAVRAVKSA